MSDARRRFQRHADYLLARYGQPARRVPVDALFSCPNRHRDGSGGCAYCDRSGARAPILGEAATIADQVRRAADFNERRYGPGFLLLYLQAYTPTSAPTERLRAVIDQALAAAPGFRGLIVSSRPDSLDDERLDLLQSYAGADFDVTLEIGLQSAHDRTLTRVMRGHTAADFSNAVSSCRARSLRVTAHVIFGLPEETQDDMLDTIRFVAGAGVDGIKIHDLHIPRDCALAADALSGELCPLSYARHLELCVRALELLPPTVVVERLTCDTPQDRLLLPRRQFDKSRLYRDLERVLQERDTYQGRLWRP